MINMFFNQSYVEPQTLMQWFGISLRTVQYEVVMINDMFKKAGRPNVQIQSRRGKGYYLSGGVADASWLEELKQECCDYLNLSINVRIGKHERGAQIIRYLLQADGFVKADWLAEFMNISMATLNKDLRWVRKFLTDYHLTIQSLPYYGMKICGQELACRSCMIDLCDIYRFSGTTIFTQQCFESFRLSEVSIQEMKGTIRSCLKRSRYCVTDRGFLRLVLYLILMPLRRNSHLSLPDSTMWQLKQLPEYQAAVELLGQGELEMEYQYLSLFLIRYAEHFSCPKADPFLSGWEDCGVVMNRIQQRLNMVTGLDITQYPEMINHLNTFICKWLFCKKYQMVDRDRSGKLGTLIDKMPSSGSLAVYLFRELPEVCDSDYEDILFYDLVFIIYRLAWQLKNEYLRTNIILINETGKEFNEMVKTRMKITGFNVVFHEYYLYELEDLDLTGFDYLLLSKGAEFDVQELQIAAYFYDFYMYKEPVLWNQLVAKKRKIGAIAAYFANPFVMDGFAVKGSLAEDVAELLWLHGNLNLDCTLEEFAETVRHIIFSTFYITNDGDKYMNLFARPNVKRKYFVIHLQDPVMLNGKQVKVLHFIVLDLSKGLVEIKNGDSEIRYHIEN